MAGNAVTLTIAGDASSLTAAAQQAEASVSTLADEVNSSSTAMSEAGQQSGRFGNSIGNAGAAAAGMSAAIGDASGTLSAFSDFMNRGQTRAREQARALLDVEQASADLNQAYGDLKQSQLDLNQSMLDAKQAGIDAEQAQIDASQAVLDAATAQDAYNEAVKEHGTGSAEARQAAIDLTQAQADLKQAGLDAEQAQADLAQAQEDGNQAARDGTQAAIDAKGAALDLAEAQSAANPGTLAKWGKELESITPLIMGVIGATNLLILANELATASWIRTAAAQVGARIATIASSVASGIATAAQWAWNLAMSANPIGLVVLAIAALVAGIVWVATQTTIFQTIWETVWGAVTAYFEFVVAAWRKVFEVAWGAIVAYFNFVVGVYRAGWDLIVGAGQAAIGWFQDIPSLLKSAFSGLFGIITAPFRAAFNFVSDAWNSTIGRLSWTIPSWVPGVGGNSISAPRLPKFHSGGVVPGPPGSEMLAILQAGETVTPTGQAAGGRTVIELKSDGTALGDLLVEILSGAIRRGGGVDVVFGGRGG